MHVINNRARQVFSNPGAFAIRTLKGFRDNQGLLLAGAVAYYSLLSLVPLLILLVIALSHVIDQTELLQTLGRYLEWALPGQSKPILVELSNFLLRRNVVSWVLLGSMLFFSSLAFTVLENAMSVIFVHRVAIHRRRFLISAMRPYFYNVFLGVGLLLMTLVSSGLQAMGSESIEFLNHHWSLGGFSGVLLYLLGLCGEILVITSIYMVMPVGRLLLRHALIGGVTAALLWEFTRHILVWYFSTLSQVRVVYGSLTSGIVVLLSLEIAATFLLFGAQVISEYEQIGKEKSDAGPSPFHTV